MRKPVYVICEQQRRSSDCTSAQSDQRLVVRCLNSTMSLVSVFAIQLLSLAYIADQARLNLTWSETPKPGFLVTWLI